MRSDLRRLLPAQGFATDAVRSRIMASIRSRDTKPEMAIRRLVHGLGYRYRLHARDLPGQPDLVFRSRRKVIFVHGCFWHQHDCRQGRRNPKKNSAYWRQKLAGNVARDGRHNRELRKAGWGVMTIWECRVDSRQLDKLVKRITGFLDRPCHGSQPFANVREREYASSSPKNRDFGVFART